MGIQIGNGNKIKNSNIAENINEVLVTDEKKRFYDKHPWIADILLTRVYVKFQNSSLCRNYEKCIW